MVTVSTGYCALHVPIKRTQSVGDNHLPLGIPITTAQDNYEVQFKEELYKRFQICQKHLIPKVEYFNTIKQLKLAATDESLKSCHGYYILTKYQFLFVVSYAEHCFLIFRMRNLPDISQFQGWIVLHLINANIPTYNK